MTEPTKRTLSDAVPASWITAYDHVWVTVYSIALGSEPEFRQAKRIVLPDAMLIACWGSVDYLDGSSVQPRFTPEGDVFIEGEITKRNSKEGAWLAVFQPCNTDQPTNEYALKVNASVLSSLLIALTTRNFAYSRLFDNCLSLTSDMTTAASPPVLNPYGFDTPSRDGLDVFRHGADALAAMSGKERRMIELSLHWFDKSNRSLGVDSFLSCWIAIETLAMPDTTDIKPINVRLGTVYGITSREAAERFCVGRLFGLRSRIVHDGADLTIQAQLSDYMFSLYKDLLHHALGMPTDHLGRIALAPDFRFDDLLKPLHPTASVAQ